MNKKQWLQIYKDAAYLAESTSLKEYGTILAFMEDIGLRYFKIPMYEFINIKEAQRELVAIDSANGNNHNIDPWDF